jgi:xanthine/uracil/vitamin C permease (AzgA family)
MISVSFSIATGIGFISYVAVKKIISRISEVTMGVWFLAFVFVVKFGFMEISK